MKTSATHRTGFSGPVTRLGEPEDSKLRGRSDRYRFPPWTAVGTSTQSGWQLQESGIWQIRLPPCFEMCQPALRHERVGFTPAPRAGQSLTPVLQRAACCWDSGWKGSESCPCFPSVSSTIHRGGKGTPSRQVTCSVMLILRGQAWIRVAISAVLWSAICFCSARSGSPRSQISVSRPFPTTGCVHLYLILRTGALS